MDTLFGGIYKGKRVFITGHTGFKGSWLALWLTQIGAKVTGYALQPPTEPNHFSRLNLKLHSVIGDVLDQEKLEQTMREADPEIVFHLAAQPIVRESYAHPVQTFATNIMGTINVLEACRKMKTVKAIVNITSDKCYKNVEQLKGYKEEDPMGGDDPYSASKGATELVSQAFRHSFFNTKDYGVKHHTLLANVRAGNVIGGGDWAKDRLIPDVMRATSIGQAVVLRNPNATRPWQHVLEPLSGYLHLGWRLLQNKVEFADNWNFGPSHESEYTVLEVITFGQKHWPNINYRIQDDPNNFHEAMLLKLDSSKARTRLKWRSVWDGSTTFARTVEWYKNFYNHGTLQSIDDLTTYIANANELQLDWTTI